MKIKFPDHELANYRIARKPIMFSEPMVKAILAGNKTMTRRKVAQQPIEREDGVWLMAMGRFGRSRKFYTNEVLEITTNTKTGKESQRRFKEPFDKFMLRHAPHKAGEVVWVREALKRNNIGAWEYSATPGEGLVANCDAAMRWAKMMVTKNVSSVSPIHMPRWASRITLEVTAVKVERLNEISGPDCMAEGLPKRTRLGDGPPIEGDIWREEKQAYRELWERINGKGSWAANPFVWAISFKRV